jgi:hypothetical protein
MSTHENPIELTFSSGESFNGEVGWSIADWASWLDAWTIAANPKTKSWRN